MSSSPWVRFRRVLLTLLGYLLVASLVLGVARTVAEILVLPRLFLTLLAGLVVLGVPLAAAVAWTYEGPDDAA